MNDGEMMDRWMDDGLMDDVKSEMGQMPLLSIYPGYENDSSEPPFFTE